MIRPIASVALLCAAVLHAHAQDITVDAAEHVFAAQHVGSRDLASRTFTVTNTGSVRHELSVQEVAVSCEFTGAPYCPIGLRGWRGDFPFRTTCRSLEPGEQCTITVSFAPQAEGERWAMLSVRARPSGPTSRIELRGTADYDVVYDEATAGELPGPPASGGAASPVTITLRPGPNTVVGTSSALDALSVTVPPHHALDTVLVGYDNDFGLDGSVSQNPYVFQISAVPERAETCGPLQQVEEMYWRSFHEFRYDLRAPLPAGRYDVVSGTSAAPAGFANRYALTFVVVPAHHYGDGFEPCTLQRLERRYIGTGRGA